MSDYFQLSSKNCRDQTTNNNEHEEAVMTSNYHPGGIGTSADIIENKIVVVDYTAAERNDAEDITNLASVSAALIENEYLLMENDKLKHALNTQLTNIRVKTLSNYDEILHSVDKFKEELFIKDLKISQLMDDMRSINKDNEEKNCIIQLLRENCLELPNEFVDKNVNGAYACSQNNNELYESKLLIADQINQIQGSTNFNSENYQLPDLIHMLARLTADKEEHLEAINRRLLANIEDQNQQLIKEIDDHKKWQKHLENENEKLSYEIEENKKVQKLLVEKEDQRNNLEEDYSKMELMYNDRCKENNHFITLFDDYRQRLTDWKIKYVDADNVIKTLQTGLIEETHKLELVTTKYKNEKEKNKINETYTQQMIDEFTIQLHEKEIGIALVQNECNILKQHIESAEADIENLKHSIITLEYVLDEKNQTILDMLKSHSKQQLRPATTYSLLFNNQLHINSKLEEQIDIILDDLGTYQKTIVGYEKVLYHMLNAVQQQSKIKDYRVTKYQHHKNIECEDKATLTDDLIKQKEVNLIRHQNEIEDLKDKYNLKISHMADTQTNMKNEIRDLNENLKLKSLHIIMAEKLAKSQLKETLITVQRLTEISEIQFLKLNDVQNEIPESPCRCFATTNTNKKRYQHIIDGLIDQLQKLKLKNKSMKKLCVIRNERIKYLENCHKVCMTKH